VWRKRIGVDLIDCRALAVGLGFRVGLGCLGLDGEQQQPARGGRRRRGLVQLHVEKQVLRRRSALRVDGAGQQGE
jgi:hypothetical protein